MPMEEIEYLIRPDGTVEEKVRGVTGRACEALTESLDSKLGRIQKREYTGEYYKQAQKVQQQEKTG